MNLHLVVDLSSFQPLAHPFLQGLDCRVLHLLGQRGDDEKPERAADQWALVDIRVPWHKGLSLIERLGQLHPNVGIIVTDAKRSIQEGAQAYQLGADVFRSDALRPEELMPLARALRKRLPQEVRPAVKETAHRLALDPARRELHGPAGTVSLADSQSRLLLAFAQAQDLTLTRAAIHTALGFDPVHPANISVPVGRLRLRLEQAGAGAKSIMSLRGKGYQLICPVYVK